MKQADGWLLSAFPADRLWLKAMLFWLNRVLPQVALWGKGILCFRRFCYAQGICTIKEFLSFYK